MPAWAFIVIVLVVVAVAVAIVAVAMRQRKTAALRDRFGPEYERTMASRPGRRAAESELRERQRERAKLDIRPLPAATRLRYGEQWRIVQERFVDQPTETVGSAERLLHEVMAERGYPVGDFAMQSGLISVDHPEVVENYRIAHAIHEQTSTGQASTEELRDALLRYRSLFDELLQAEEADPQDERAQGSRDDEAPDGPAPDEAPVTESRADEAGPRVETVPARNVAGDTPMEPEVGHDPR
jgi:hypothetical protein